MKRGRKIILTKEQALEILRKHKDMNTYKLARYEKISYPTAYKIVKQLEAEGKIIQKSKVIRWIEVI